MNKIELEQRIAALVAEAKAITAKAGVEGRDLSADDQSKIDANIAAVEKIRADIARLDAIDKAEATMEAHAPRRTTPDNPGKPLVTGVRDRVEDDPKAGFRTDREFYGAVMAYGLNRKADSRLNHLRIGAAAGSDEQSTFSDSHGSFLVPSGYRPTLLTRDAESDPIAGRTTAIPMGSPRVEIPARTDSNHTTSVSGGLTVSRRSEAVAAASSRMQVEKVALVANGLFGVNFATRELLSDSPITIQAIIAQGFRDEFAANHIKECLRGTGVGEYEGIANCPATVDVAKEVGQAAATIVYNNVLKMRSRCWGYGNAIWLANHDCLPQLAVLSVPVGTGGQPIYHFSAQEDVPDTLLGKPIYYTEFCETLGTVGDLICVNWSQFLEGTLADAQGEESMHVRFLEHEMAFKFWTRNDGRSWWRAALTPNKSSATLSPFVRLATRA